MITIPDAAPAKEEKQLAGESYRITNVTKEKLVPGMILARTIHNNTDKVVLFEENVELTANTIAQIQKIPYIFEVEIKENLKRH